MRFLRCFLLQIILQCYNPWKYNSTQYILLLMFYYITIIYWEDRPRYTDICYLSDLPYRNNQINSYLTKRFPIYLLIDFFRRSRRKIEEKKWIFVILILVVNIRTVSLAVFPHRWAGGAVSVRSPWRRRTLRGVQSAGGGYTGAARRGLPRLQVD